MFSFLRNYLTIFSSACIILYSHQQCVSDPVSPQYCQHLMIPLFFILAVLRGVLWYLMILICISNALFMCLSSVYHLQICQFMSFLHFLIGLFVFYNVEFWKYFMYSRYVFIRYVTCKFVSQSVICLLHSS